MWERITVLVLTALAGVGSALAQTDGTQQAVWERAKGKAVTRQVHTVKPAEVTVKPAEAAVKPNETKPAEIKPVEIKDPGPAMARQSDSEVVEEAVRWERAKDHAAQRQSQMEAAGSNGATANTVMAKPKKK